MGIILRLKLELEYCFVAFISKFVKQNSYKKQKPNYLNKVLI